MDKLKKFGQKKPEILKQINITKVKQLKCLHGQTQLQKDMVKAMKGIEIKTLTNYIDQALSAMSGNCPPAIDHTKSETPYESMYGKDAKKRLEESVSLNKFCSINKMIDHMMQASQEVFRGTVHEKDWKVYHDALIIITGQAALTYMQDKDYLQRMIMPQNGLNAGTKWSHCAIGNQPGLMPLDMHLNEDIHDCVDNHERHSSSLPMSDPRKFSKRCPKRLASAYARLYDPSLGPNAGAPLGRRIKQDVDRVVNETYLQIFNARGIVVGTGRNKGRRYVKTGGQGGKRIKAEEPLAPVDVEHKDEEDSEDWIHPDVAFLPDMIVEGAVQKVK